MDSILAAAIIRGLDNWWSIPKTAAYTGTGGMIALYPRRSDAEQMAVPGGEPVEELHLTLVFLGDDVTNAPVSDLAMTVGQIADMYSVITARVFGHAQFNPDGFEEREPCAVYLVGHSPELAQLHDRLAGTPFMPGEISKLFPVPDQHEPWVPHLTAGYHVDPGALGFTGDIIFDRLGLAAAGQVQFFPLAGA